MTGRRGRRSKHLLDDVKEMGEYWKLKEVALDRTLWITMAIDMSYKNAEGISQKNV